MKRNEITTYLRPHHPCVCSIRKSRPESLRVLTILNPNPKNRPWAEQGTASEYMAVRMHSREEELETVDLLPLKM